MRKPLPLEVLAKRVRDINGRLEALQEPAILTEEAFAARLYTGPMFVKYNDLLRGFGPALAGCKGNCYVTTTHAINSVIKKCAKLTVAAKVYRGVAGGEKSVPSPPRCRLRAPPTLPPPPPLTFPTGTLPSSFWKPNAQGVRGGIESAFMSTTFDRRVAMQYASRPGRPGLVFEFQMGMIDRGCELDWISQYPNERECLFAPLTGIEVHSTRVEGTVLVVEARLSVNLNALTIEEIIAKRHKMLLDMAHDMKQEAWRRYAGRPTQGLAVAGLEAALQRPLGHEHEWYNVDHQFVEAVAAALEAKRTVSRHGDEGLVALVSALPSDVVVKLSPSNLDVSKRLLRCIFRALRDLGPAAVAPFQPAVAELVRERDTAAVDLLGSLDGPSLELCADHLALLLQDEDRSLRVSAMRLLTRLEPSRLERHKDMLSNCLDDPSWSADVVHAVHALARLEPCSRAPYAWRLVRMAQPGADAGVCQRVLEALVTLELEALSPLDLVGSGFAEAHLDCPDTAVKLAALRLQSRLSVAPTKALSGR